jgi:hypothetical protein
MFSNFFLKIYCLWDNVEKYSRVKQATDNITEQFNHIASFRYTLKYLMLIAFLSNSGYTSTPQCYVFAYSACVVMCSLQKVQK